MSLEQAMHSLVQDIASSHQERTGGVQQIRKATEDKLKEADAAVSSIAGQRRASTARLHTELHNFHLTLTKGHAELQSNVGAERQGLVRAHHTMAQGQRAVLTKGRAAMTRFEGGRKAQVNAWLGDVAGERKDAHKEWITLGTAKDNHGSDTPATDGTPVFEYLASHPDGTRLTEIDHNFHLGRPQAAGSLRKLMNEGKVEKRGALYFAV
ncbi:MAG: hypothetical protein HY531_02370 [Chloroflexi bacterium]|nr:hypothetical protein [Chloroflexota bacterium]